MNTVCERITAEPTESELNFQFKPNPWSTHQWPEVVNGKIFYPLKWNMAARQGRLVTKHKRIGSHAELVPKFSIDEESHTFEQEVPPGMIYKDGADWHASYRWSVLD